MTLDELTESMIDSVEKKWKWLLRYYPERPPMFEYDVVEVPADPQMMADKLNQFGEDGWEVCALYNHTILSTRMYAVVKRHKPLPKSSGKCMCHVGLPGYVCEYCKSLGHGSSSEN